MAKSIEQKVVEAIANGLSDSRFRHPEFAKLMIEEHPLIHKTFFQLLKSYMTYISVHARYDYYPNGIQQEAMEAEEIMKVIRKSP